MILSEIPSFLITKQRGIVRHPKNKWIPGRAPNRHPQRSPRPAGSCGHQPLEIYFVFFPTGSENKVFNLNLSDARDTRRTTVGSPVRSADLSAKHAIPHGIILSIEQIISVPFRPLYTN